MFSLIATIISIALVAALAVVTIFYGGSLFTTGGAKAQAATVINAAAQVVAANTIYEATAGGQPASDVSTLVTRNFLKNVPNLPSSILSFGLSGKGVVATVSSADVCRAITGKSVIAPAQATPMAPDCYGTVSPYKFTYNSSDIASGSAPDSAAAATVTATMTRLGVSLDASATYTPASMSQGQRAYCQFGAGGGTICAGDPFTVVVAANPQPGSCKGASGYCDSTYMPNWGISWTYGGCMPGITLGGQEIGSCLVNMINHTWGGTAWGGVSYVSKLSLDVLVAMAPISCSAGSYSVSAGYSYSPWTCHAL